MTWTKANSVSNLKMVTKVLLSMILHCIRIQVAFKTHSMVSLNFITSLQTKILTGNSFYIIRLKSLNVNANAKGNFINKIHLVSVYNFIVREKNVM